MRRPRNRTPRALPAVLFAAAALLASACGPGRPPCADVRAGAGGEESTLLDTDAANKGREIFRRENCDRCHTLFDRPPSSGGLASSPAPAVDLLDSRVGPDLGLEGHRRSDEWQLAHLYAPAAVVRGSRMPASRHLFRPEAGRPTPGREAVDLVAYLQALGRARRDIWAERRRRDPAVASPPPTVGELARRGDELYGRHCEPCHGAGGDGRGELAGFFSFPPRDFVRGRYRFKSTPPGQPPADADLYRSITLGTGTGSAMPAFDWLEERDRWALVLRIKEFSPALRGKDLRAEDDADRWWRIGGTRGRGAAGGANGEMAGEGRRLWESLGCASCHGASGSGMTRAEAGADWTDGAGVVVPRSGDLTHACALRAGASERALERALMFGVGDAMPSYADALPDEAGRGALVAFILSLDRARKPEPAGR